MCGCEVNAMASIPAWKRLGLKLKFAKERPGSKVTALNEGNRNRGYEPNGTLVESDRPSKKRRITSSNKSDMRSTSPNHQLLSSPKRKKSVSFSYDTKTEDGDSRITIDFPVGHSGSPGTTTKRVKSNGIEFAGVGEESETADEPTGRMQPSIKSKKKSGNSETDFVSRKSRDSLGYLNQHHTNRAEWKYNKNRDVWVMKNALSTESIPSTHNRALAGYVYGLPTNAGARTRLLQQSQAGRVGNTETRRNEQYERILMDDLEGSNASSNEEVYQDWLKNLPRPHLLLLALGVSESVNDRIHINDDGITHNLPSEKPTRYKKKKSRTTAVVEISSSSDSASEDSSGESSGTNGTTTAIKASQTAEVNSLQQDDSTSSSGSSSSDSSSEDTSNSSE